MTEQGNWQTCIVDTDYEIFSEFPHQIRRKSNKRIVKEFIGGNGYVSCKLNSKAYHKHRIVALQFIPNPDNLEQVDHINRDRTDFHIQNLRFVSRSDNLKNKSSNLNVEYEYVDSIDDNAIEINDYGNHHFEFYYYVEADDSFYYYTGHQYRKLHINIDKRWGTCFICMYDVDNKFVKVFINKFKRLYGILNKNNFHFCPMNHTMRSVTKRHSG